ncbi:putative Vacuolar protein sorting-associated protein 8 [Glarea lozoyensis 74030]|uniref:Putative Vacuolar protein sorting-associated protein 8 n=1 Tax=Glarea lozoyensis (strain ATCC 74030 / MF5533) TaxID=1104152 RepID=H0EH52_GLAL7|nr:putative Vacuolar protein sorting-associated protein 8 [Glarea lozoyensis 74030]
MANLLPSFEKAGFYRVLKSTYKADKQFGKLVQAYFDDPENQEEVFDCIADCLRPRSGLTKRQIRDVHEVMEAHASDLVHLDAVRTAQIIELKLESTLQGLLSGSDEDMQSIPVGEAAQDLLDALQKYTGVGIWLCRGQEKLKLLQPPTPTRRKASPHDELLPDETLWLDLIDVAVQITRKISASLSDVKTSGSAEIDTYAYEESILSLSNRLLEKDLFVNVKSATELRQRGWRPRGSTCEGCGRRVWGPGVSGDVFSKWEDKQAADLKRRKERTAELAGSQAERGKGKAHTRTTSKSSIVDGMRMKGKVPAIDGQSEGEDLGPLVVLACRHIYHQACLEAVQVDEGELVVDGREFRCPIDGPQSHRLIVHHLLSSSEAAK